jgi:hypothetical protein
VARFTAQAPLLSGEGAGKRKGGGAHRGGRASVGWRGCSGGGLEEVKQRVDGHEGDLAPTGGGPLGWRGNGRQWPGRGARGRRTCPHSGGRRRVADEWGPAGSGRARGREAWDTHGPVGEGNGVDRARMNSDDFQLFKPISNELEWF